MATKQQSAPVSHKLALALSRFAEYHPPVQVKNNLQKMLFDYLKNETATENTYFPELIRDLEGLFELLDQMEGSTENQEV